MYATSARLQKRRHADLTHPCTDVRSGSITRATSSFQTAAARSRDAYYLEKTLPRRVQVQPDVHRNVPSRKRSSRAQPVLYGTTRVRPVASGAAKSFLAEPTTARCRISGWKCADTLAELISMGRIAGAQPANHDAAPPADPHRRRQVKKHPGSNRPWWSAQVDTPAPTCASAGCPAPEPTANPRRRLIPAIDAGLRCLGDKHVVATAPLGKCPRARTR